MKIFGNGVFAVALMLALVGCRQPPSVEVPVVTGVTVSRIAGTPLSGESAATVQRGGTAYFAAVVEGTHLPPQSVNWYIADGGRLRGTGISAAGVLRVDAGETLDRLTVGARSTFDIRRFGHITVYLEGEIANQDRLARPQIELEGSVLVWDGIPGAGGYSLRIDGIEVPGGDLGRNARSFDLADLPLPVGEHSVTLVALGVPGQSLDSPESNTVIFSVTGEAQPGVPRLDAPVITLYETTVSWDGIPGAGGYSLRVGGFEVPGGDLGSGVTSFDLAGLGLPFGTHSVTLVALGVPGESLNSPASDPAIFRVIFQGNFSIDPPDFPPPGGGIDTDIVGPVISLLDGTVETIQVSNPGAFDPGSIKWFFAGLQIERDQSKGSHVSGDFGEILVLGSRIHGELLSPGAYFLTVEVTVGGEPRSRRVSFTVTM
ncbi:MAG: hypothetical protein FWB79_02385 [Treponema sp.]|nr:hypothetical protein [Treponema sp.]